MVERPAKPPTVIEMEVKPSSGPPPYQPPTRAEEKARLLGYHLPSLVELLDDDFEEAIEILISKGIIDRASIKKFGEALSYAGSSVKKAATREANKYCDESGNKIH